MAGCFGNDPFDRHMENQLNRYLDEQDASAELFETRDHEDDVTGWFNLPEGTVPENDDDYVNFEGYMVMTNGEADFSFDTEVHDETFINKYSKYIPTINTKLQEKLDNVDNWEEEHDYDGVSIKWVGGDLSEIEVDLDKDDV